MNKQQFEMWISGYFAALEGVPMTKQLIEKTQRLILEKVKELETSPSTPWQSIPTPAWPAPISPLPQWPNPNPNPQWPPYDPNWPLGPIITCTTSDTIKIRGNGQDANSNNTSNPTRHKNFFTGDSDE